MTTAKAEITITPEMMAEAFWGMSDTEQSEFFEKLAFVIKNDCKTNNSAYGHGEMQWHYLAKRLTENGKTESREMLMAMAAPLYLNTLRYCGQ